MDLPRPSLLDQRFLDEARGRTVYVHAMHSFMDWFAYAIWTGDGTLRRSLSLSPGSGVVENRGTALAFEAPYWAGGKPVDDGGGDEDEDEDEDEQPYPLPFHPLEMAEDALRHLFGFNYEGFYLPDDPDLFHWVLAGFVVEANLDGAQWTMRTEHGPAWPKPDRQRIAVMLRGLAEDNFAILERADGRFVQAIGGSPDGVPTGWYAIEHQDGGPDRHYTARTREFTDVVRLFQDFADGDGTWRERHDWKRLRL